MIDGCVETADVIHAVRFGRENNLLLPYAAAATTVRDWRSAVEQGMKLTSVGHI
jgi:hypothetical protein